MRGSRGRIALMREGEGRSPDHVQKVPAFDWRTMARKPHLAAMPGTELELYRRRLLQEHAAVLVELAIRRDITHMELESEMHGVMEHTQLVICPME
jgi:hypothetical protein